MSKEWPEILPQDRHENHRARALARGEILSKSNRLDENKVLKPGEKIEISAVRGPWLIVKMPATAAEADPHADAFIQHPL